MTDDQPRSILQRMTDAGISEDRAREHLAAGTVRLDGEVVTDPDAPAAKPARWVVGPG